MIIEAERPYCITVKNLNLMVYYKNEFERIYEFTTQLS